MVSYEIAMGFALVAVLMAAGSLNLGEIVEAQARRLASGLLLSGLAALPLFVVYFVSRRRRDQPRAVRRGRGRIGDRRRLPRRVLGHDVRVFFLAEYMNMILISALTAMIFFGGWLSPFEGYAAWLARWLARRASSGCS